MIGQNGSTPPSLEKAIEIIFNAGLIDTIPPGTGRMYTDHDTFIENRSDCKILVMVLSEDLRT